MATRTHVLDTNRTARISHQVHVRESPTPAKVEVTLLGGFEARLDGHLISPGHWSRRHSAALVKLLALTSGRRLHREQVMDALWPDLDVDHAAPRLHKAAHYTRKAFAHRDAVVLSADTVDLFPHGELQVDATQFQESAESALSNGGIAAAKAALAAYSGVLLPHDLYEPWTATYRLHLGRLYTELLHQAADWHQALAIDPTDEPAHLALAQQYAENGDRVAALRQLDRLDQVMHHELGLEPSKDALSLRRRLLEPTSAGAGGVDSCCGAPASGLGTASRREARSEPVRDSCDG